MVMWVWMCFLYFPLFIWGMFWRIVSLWCPFNASRGLWVVVHVVARVIRVDTCRCKELCTAHVEVVFDF